MLPVPFNGQRNAGSRASFYQSPQLCTECGVLYVSKTEKVKSGFHADLRHGEPGVSDVLDSVVVDPFSTTWALGRGVRNAG